MDILKIRFAGAEEEIDNTLRFIVVVIFFPRYDRTPLTLSTVGAKGAEAEGVGRRVGAAANSGERTRTPATGRGELARASRTSSCVVEELAGRA